jgi:hypothetical protein
MPLAARSRVVATADTGSSIGIVGKIDGIEMICGL